MEVALENERHLFSTCRIANNVANSGWDLYSLVLIGEWKSGGATVQLVGFTLF